MSESDALLFNGIDDADHRLRVLDQAVNVKSLDNFRGGRAPTQRGAPAVKDSNVELALVALLVALALGGFCAQLGRDQQALNLRQGQPPFPLGLPSGGELVVR